MRIDECSYATRKASMGGCSDVGTCNGNSAICAEVQLRLSPFSEYVLHILDILSTVILTIPPDCI